MPSTGSRIMQVEVLDDVLSMQLADGRALSVPLAWFPRLFEALCGMGDDAPR